MQENELELLKAQNAALLQQVMQLQGLLGERSRPIFTACLDAMLNYHAAAAQGDEHSRELIGKWMRVQDQMRELLSGRPAIMVVNGLPPQTQN